MGWGSIPPPSLLMRRFALLGHSHPTIISGIYTPTLTNVANLTASTSYVCQYIRIANSVLVAGRVDIDPTLIVLSCQLGISLPIASDFTNIIDCAGTAAASGVASQNAAVLADITNNRAQMQWIASDLSNQPMYFSFTYRIL